jgi:hypothetical protein
MKKKLSPNELITITRIAVKLGENGFSARFIHSVLRPDLRKRISVSGIYYLLRKSNIHLTDYRNGKSETATSLLAKLQEDLIHENEAREVSRTASVVNSLYSGGVHRST